MSEHFKTIEVSTLVEALEYCLELRSGVPKFWSFRGQRTAQWDVGLHHPRFSGVGKREVSPPLAAFLAEFRRRCMQFPVPPYVEDHQDWRWLFFAQHHRLKTRLLDWTKNPLVAIYFAVENIVSVPTQHDEGRRPGAVWALHVREEDFVDAHRLKGVDSFRNKKWFMINPPPITPRLNQQGGVFTFHPGDGPWEPLNKMSRRKGEQLLKIEFVGDITANDICDQLGIIGIHHAAMFPEPQGIAEFVNEQWPSIARPGIRRASR